MKADKQRKIRIDISDVHVYLGVLLIGAGAWLVYRPAAPIVVGLILVWLGTRGAA